MASNLKSSFKVDHKIESFFTGSQIEFDSTGEHLFCSYGPCVNKLSIRDGQIKAQVRGNNDEDSVIRFSLSPNNKLIVIAYHSGLIVKFNLDDDTIEREFKSIHSAPISQMKIDQANSLLATASSDGTIKLWNLGSHYCSHNLKGINGMISSIEFLKLDNGPNLLFAAGGDDNVHVFDIESNKRVSKLSTHCSTITDMKFCDSGRKLITVGRDKIAVVWDLSGDPETYKSLRTIPLFESVESLVILDSPEIFSNLVVIREDQVKNKTLFATIGEEGSIKVWDTQTGSKILSQTEQPLSSDRNPGSHCYQLCLRPKHSELCAVSAERDLFFYQLPEFKLVQQLQGHIDEVLSACWFANNSHIAMACNSNDLKVMELSTSKCQHLKGHTDIVLCVKTLACDQHCLLSSSKDCSVLVWSFDAAMKPTILFRASGHTHVVCAIGTLRDEKIFFSGGEDLTLKSWSIEQDFKSERDSDSRSPRTIIARQTVKAHEGRIDDIAVSPNDQIIATASRDKTAKLFSVDGLRTLVTLKGHRRGVNSVQFSPVDQILITAADVCIRMWNLQDYSCVKTFQGHDCAVLNCSFLPSGLQILSVGSDGNMKLWDCKTNECVKTFDAHEGTIHTMAVNDSGDRVITGGVDEALLIWRDTTKEEQDERLENLKLSVTQEQDFMNYINKKKWMKALKVAISMENSAKTLSVIREILLEQDGLQELQYLISKISLDKLDFIINCCNEWTASAKNRAVAQQVLYIIIRQLNHEQLLCLPSLKQSSNELRDLTRKSFDRFEQLVQQAVFADFFFKSIKIE